MDNGNAKCEEIAAVFFAFRISVVALRSLSCAMAGPLADIFFWLAVLATAVAHVFILRSTYRGARASSPRHTGAWEWVWALLPAAGLVVLFAFTWRAMHPGSLTLIWPGDRPPTGVIRS
jgi:heme/copper-type cytochrome/quinol oxidase subunit 2